MPAMCLNSSASRWDTVPLPCEAIFSAPGLLAARRINSCTDAAGTLALGNGTGILIREGANNNTIGGTTAGAGNLIAFNTGYGVSIDGATTTGNAITGSIDNGIGSVGLLKQGTSTWTLLGNLSYSGLTQVTGGVLQIAPDAGTQAITSTPALSNTSAADGTDIQGGRLVFDYSHGQTTPVALLRDEVIADPLTKKPSLLNLWEVVRIPRGGSFPGKALRRCSDERWRGRSSPQTRVSWTIARAGAGLRSRTTLPRGKRSAT